MAANGATWPHPCTQSGTVAEDIDIASDVVPEVGTAVIAIAPGSISFCDVCVFVIYFSYVCIPVVILPVCTPVCFCCHKYSLRTNKNVSLCDVHS